jgi:hypothetical protein
VFRLSGQFDVQSFGAKLDSSSLKWDIREKKTTKFVTLIKVALKPERKLTYGMKLFFGKGNLTWFKGI